MNRISASLGVIALIAVSGCTAASQEPGRDAGTLQAQDYIDIRQLIEGYS